MSITRRFFLKSSVGLALTCAGLSVLNFSSKTVKKYMFDTLVVGDEDVNNLLEYCHHFNVSMPKSLTKAANRFKANKNLDTQQDFACELMKFIIKSDDDSFKDPLWDTVRISANKKLKENNLA